MFILIEQNFLITNNRTHNSFFFLPNGECKINVSIPLVFAEEI